MWCNFGHALEELRAGAWRLLHELGRYSTAVPLYTAFCSAGCKPGKCLPGTSTTTLRVTCTGPGCCLMCSTKPSMALAKW